MGYGSTIDYLVAMSALVLKETGLLPHVNPGVMTRDEIAVRPRSSLVVMCLDDYLAGRRFPLGLVDGVRDDRTGRAG